MRDELPSGSVTLLFTDIEGSTRLLSQLGAEVYDQALAEHRRLLREAFARRGGIEVDTQGDAFFYAFPSAAEAAEGAREGQRALSVGPIRVRMGLHTGRPHVGEEGYVGEDVHLAARIAAAGHGGQVLVSEATHALIDGELANLGEHRLKDFAEPVWLFQLGLERFPPLKTISNTNLPRPASSFVGREQEVAEVVELLRGGARLVTLSGPGGSGKTRLAIESAAELVPEFRNGVFWIGLAALRDSALVAETVAQTLGAKDGLAEHIADREQLLLLDNFEQVVEAAPELASLLESCPNLRLLVTSRELLRTRGEVDYPVPPLAQPEAVELFCARSRLDQSDDIAELCARLDNLPLAVELAAARTNVLSPAQTLDRLSQRLDLLKGGRDSEARQQTLRTTIEWSHELLNGEEQQLFARLAVFVGGCTLDAAERVCEADLDPLQSLVDKSLVQARGADRFWMLETIRQYAAERLAQLPAVDKLKGHQAEYFLAFAEEIEPNLVGKGSRGEWLDLLEREHDNLRAAFDWFEASGETDRVLRLTAALWRFWDVRGHLVEGRRRLESALHANERPTLARARALSGAADMALTAGDIATGGLRAREALELHHALGDAWGVAFSRLMVAYATGLEGDWASAKELFGESVRQFRELGDQHYALRAARAHAWAHYESGNLDRARALDEQILCEAREAHDPFPEGIALGELADVALDQGRVQDAVPLTTDSHRIFRDLGDLLLIAGCVGRFARILALSGRPEIAARVLSSSAAQLNEIGAMPPHIAKIRDQTLVAIRPQLDEVTFNRAWEEGQALTADEAVALALDSLA